MIDDALNERQCMIEKICNDYLDGALDEHQIHQLVHGLLIDADLRNEMRRLLFLHEALETFDFSHEDC